MGNQKSEWEISQSNSGRTNIESHINIKKNIEGILKVVL